MANQAKATPVLSKATTAELEALPSTAAKIKFLLAQGFSRGDVSRILGIRYQWVRNVDVQQAAKATATDAA